MTKREQKGSGKVLCGPISLPKGLRGSLRLSVDRFDSQVVLSARLWYRGKGSTEPRPTPKGWILDLVKLPDVIAALQQLEAEAKAKGLLA